MRPWTVEQSLLTEALRRGIGIFACDEPIVISSNKVTLGTDVRGKECVTWVIQKPPDAMGVIGQPGVTTSSWLNTETFMKSWDAILAADSKIWKKDFLVKADPDAVLFPDRLRKHVSSKVGQPVMYLNCNYNGQPKLFGSLEIYSKEAMDRYRKKKSMCIDGLPWHGWGEDLYMSVCMKDVLGVTGVNDFALVGDHRCVNAPCTDTWRAAFHPFKDVGSYVACWSASTNNWR
jgi:hypothetical protein